MALIQASRFSKTLGMETEFSLCLPHSSYDEAEIKPEKIIYLLHGAQGNCNDWFRKTRVELYAQGRNIAIVSLSGFLSGYQDMEHGFKLYSYITEELIPYVEKAFCLEATREKRIIAGLSMGGRGAMLLGLKRPDLFSKIGTFSCAIDMPTGIIPWDIIGNMDGGFDIRKIIKENIAKNIKMPKIHMEIGLQDQFLPYARETREFILAQNSKLISLNYREKTGGHSWELWDSALLNFIRSLKLSVKAGIY